jgi:hypothetical protein
MHDGRSRAVLRWLERSETDTVVDLREAAGV